MCIGKSVLDVVRKGPSSVLHMASTIVSIIIGLQKQYFINS